MQRIALFGSTGSIGEQTVQVVTDAPERYRIDMLVARRSVEALVAQAQRLRPRFVSLVDDSLIPALDARLPSGTTAISFEESLARIAEVDIVLNAVMGFAGLPVTRAALLAGCRLALANKESLIASGELVDEWRRHGAGEIIPVDSEHSAIFQCLGGNGTNGRGVDSLILTASGGPFRTWSAESLEAATVEDALAHPTWKMGRKITVDSSTLVNKGLEVIEAHFLFGVDYDDIEVVVHPQSIVHSMVRFTDGSVLAQLSEPDMRLPIAVALAYPERSATPFGSLRFSDALSLTFEAPRTEVFRGLGVAFLAGRLGGSAPCWFNATNEVLVDAFLEGIISWGAIGELLDDSLEAFVPYAMTSIEDVLEVDRLAREHAGRQVKVRASE
jgi:1-deoxy-D-xylulose-5-phosphate reductoisomerase